MGPSFCAFYTRGISSLFFISTLRIVWAYSPSALLYMLPLYRSMSSLSDASPSDDDVNSITSSGCHSSPSELGPALPIISRTIPALGPDTRVVRIGCLRRSGDGVIVMRTPPSLCFTSKYLTALALRIPVSRPSQYRSNRPISLSPALCT